MKQETIQEIIDYLAKQPYREVAPLINKIVMEVKQQQQSKKLKEGKKDGTKDQ